VSSPSVGPILIMLGLGLALVGLLVWAGAFGWFGRLPGDIRIERGTVHVYIPIVSMLVVSIVLTLLLNLISRFFE
jgi:Zn-dependent protease with chaperone function